MKILTYNAGNRRTEFSVAITRLDADRVFLTSMPIRGYGICNGHPTYQSVIVHRSEMVDTLEAKVGIWEKCGVVGARETNADIVPAICEILDCPNPGFFVHRY